jgi:hypothetical protein
LGGSRPWNYRRPPAFPLHGKSEAKVMTAAVTRARTHNGADLARAAVALVIAGACIGLLIFMLTPQRGDAVNGSTENGQMYLQRPASNGAAKLIPI